MALAVAALQVSILVATAGSAQARTIWPLYPGGTSMPVALSFSEPPTTGDLSDRSLLDELKRMIHDSESGDLIRMGIYSVNYQPLIDEMAAAKARGVTIATVGPKANESAALNLALGTNARWCANPPSGCIANDSSSLMHAKYAAFSWAKDPSGIRRQNVTWISSSNLMDSSGYHAFNDAITTYGDTSLYNKVVEIWQNMWTGGPYRGVNYFDQSIGRGYVAAPTGQLYASPEQETDLVASALSNISGRSNTCWVKVQHNSLSGRGQVTAELRRLKSENCRVQVLISSITRAMCTNLRNAGAGQITELRQLPTVLHSKFITFFDGGASWRVLTGSHNLTNSANYLNDEFFFRSPNYQPYYDNYSTHFNLAWARGSTAVTATDGQPCL
jgi:hypothetical protein